MSGEPTAAPAVAIREAGRGDRGAIRELLDELGYPLEVATLARRMDRLTADPSIRVFVAARDEKVVGLVSLHVLHLIERPPLGRLSAIVVTRAARRSGIGQALVDRVEEEARAAGCDRLEVTSGDWREDAHAFYRDLEFEETSKRFIKGL
jgi:N-acetylglutamate synthase-like GNAT family acetyltransferase